MPDFVTALEWSPQGDRLAIGAADGSLSIWTATEGKKWFTLKGHGGGVDSLSWRPDGKVLVSGGQDGLVKFWSFEATDVHCTELPGGAAWVEHVAWNRPDNDDPRYPRLASSSGKKLKLWDYEGKLVREFPEHPKTILDVQWHPSRPLIAAAVFGGVMVWGTKDGELHKNYVLPSAILKVSWSPNGQWLVTGNQDASVHLWKTKTGEELHMRGYETKVRELSWDATSTFMAAGGSAVISVWDCSSEDGPAGQTPERLDWHVDLVGALAFAHQGLLLASGSGDGRVALWDVAHQVQDPIGIAYMTGEVSQLAWSRDDTRIAVADGQGTVKMLGVL